MKAGQIQYLITTIWYSDIPKYSGVPDRIRRGEGTDAISGIFVPGDSYTFKILIKLQYFMIFYATITYCNKYVSINVILYR